MPAEWVARLLLSLETIETNRDRFRQKPGLSDGTELTRCGLQRTLPEDRRLQIG
jgi:hypothetical protein